MPEQTPVFRFAPSPNGYLHLGHAYSAVIGWQTARAMGGRFLLRIEDIDKGRARPEFEAAILDDLQWLGIEWERPVRRQSDHFAFYTETLDRLSALGLIYPCFATRREIAQAAADQGKTALRDPDGAMVYPGLYRNMSEAERRARITSGESYALRLDMKKAAALATDIVGGPVRFCSFNGDGQATEEIAAPERWGDIVLARKDTPASYHIAVTADDAFQGVTHIMRGTDLLAATDIHRLLQILLDLPEPVYCHHRLIVDETGRKLSKSHRDKSLKSLREEGLTPDDIFRLIGLA